MRLHELKNTGMNEYYYVRRQLTQFTDNLSLKAFDAGDRQRDAIKTVKEFEARRSEQKGRFLNAIGGIPDCTAPLCPQITGVIQENGFRIEKVIFQARPGVYITANLYVPDGISQPVGAVLFLCGHAKEAKAYRQYQKVCRHLVNAGLVVLAQDPVGQGERLGYYEKKTGAATVDWGVIEHDYAGMQCMLIGDGTARYFVHDAMRGIDYLCTRPEVDRARIGVTGNSGGGTQTALVMLCDSRVAAAAPGTFIMNRRVFTAKQGVQDAEQIWDGMSALGFDHEDILLAMAPKPVLVLAVNYDFFPVEGTRETYERSERFWELYGHPENLEMFADNSTHAYTEQMAEKAADFFSRHLHGRSYKFSGSMQTIESSSLNCTQSGQVRGEYPDARFVYEENSHRIKEIIAAKAGLPDEELEAKALSWLREKVFFNRQSCGLNPRFYSTEQAEELIVQKCFWWSQKGIFNHAFLFRSLDFSDMVLPVTVAVWDNGTSQIKAHIDWLRKTCNDGRAVMVLDVSGMGALEQASLGNEYTSDAYDFYDIYYKTAHDLIWLGDSLPALRSYDVIRALDMLQVWDGIDAGDIRVFTCGRQGVYGRFAALLDSRIKVTETEGGKLSFSELGLFRHYNSYDISSIIMPGILRYYDVV